MYIHIAPAKYRSDNIICEYFEEYRISLMPHSRIISKCLMFKTKVAKFLRSTFDMICLFTTYTYTNALNQ